MKSILTCLNPEGGILLKYIVIVVLLTVFSAITGCDEAMQVAGPVMPEPADTTENTETAEPPTTIGKVKQDPEEKEEPEDPADPEPKPPEGSVTYEYINGVAVAEILPPTAWVLDFPGPYREYTPPESSPEDFVGRVCMPVGGGPSAGDWAPADYVAPVSKVLVTITDGPRRGEQITTGADGYFLFRDSADELYLRVEREYLEPKEVIVSRSRPTVLQEISSNRVFNAAYQERERLRPRNAPGTILMELRWPDAIRFILESEKLPYGLSYGIENRSPDPALAIGGGYASAVHKIALYNSPEDKGRISYGILMHELAHARQHAIAIINGGNDSSNWDNAPEGKSYRVAWEKDLREIPEKHWLGTLDKSDYFTSSLIENAAEFCALYWKLGMGGSHVYEETWGGGIQKRAPNRFKWCQEHLNQQY